MRIINASNNSVLAEEVILAESLPLRLKGLLGRSGLKPGQAMVLKPCISVHTFFMRFSIDVAFVDGANRVIKAIPDLRPWRSTGIYPSARLCIEMPAGTLASTRTSSGDPLIFRDTL